jgi:hypothetical protein
LVAAENIRKDGHQRRRSDVAVNGKLKLRHSVKHLLAMACDRETCADDFLRESS